MAPRHKHAWFAYDTATWSRKIIVRCECGARGIVPEHVVTARDWERAFRAKSVPYRVRPNLQKTVVKVVP